MTEAINKQSNEKSAARKWAGRVGLVGGGVVIGGALIAVPFGFYNNITGSHTTGAVAGELVCPTGEKVVGGWIEPSDHRDRGWVALNVDPKEPNIATFIAGLPHDNSAWYNVGVGCGGTPAVWEHNDQSPNISVSTQFVMLQCTDTQGVKAGSCGVSSLPFALPRTATQ